MSDLSSQALPEPEKPKSSSSGFGKQITFASIGLFIIAVLPTEAFLASLIIGGGIIWILLDLLKQYKKAFGAPAEGFGISAANSYRTKVGAPPLPAKGLKQYADEVYLANTQMLADLQRFGALDELAREQLKEKLTRDIFEAKQRLRAVNSELNSVRDELLDVRQIADRHNVGFLRL